MIPLYDNQHTRSSPAMTLALIVANVVVFAAWQLSVGLAESVQMAALVPSEVTMQTPGGAVYILTSMFMHGTWLHLIGNMWFLWIFGSNIEDLCGRFRYLILYIVCGAAAAGAHIFADPTSTTPVIGASGAVSAILGAYFLKHPRAQIRTLVPMRIIEIPAFVFLLIWVGLQLLAQMTAGPRAGGSGVSYVAHVGGFLAGMVLIKIFVRRRDHRLSGGTSWVRNKTHERSWG